MAASNSRRKGVGLVQFDSRATTRNIQVSARNALGQFTKFQGAVLKANQRSLATIQELASENLTKSINAHGRPQDRNSGRLKRAIEDPSNSSATVDGFAFMQDAKVRREVPYYRAVERGSDYWVGKRLPFLFLGGGNEFHGPNTSARRSGGVSGGRRNDHLVGPREYRTLAYGGGEDRRVITIRNPVPRYGYAAKARRTFLQGKMYDEILKEEAAQFVRDTGATVTFT